MAVVDRWSLFRGSLYNKNQNWAFKMVTFVGRWPLFRGGCKLGFDCTVRPVYTSNLGTTKLWPLLTGGPCSEVAYKIKIKIGPLKW